MSYWIICRPNNQNLCRSMPWNRKTLCWSKQSAVCYPMLDAVLWKFNRLGMPFKLSWSSIRLQAWSWKALCCWMSFTLLCLWIYSLMCYQLQKGAVWRPCYQNLQRLSFRMSHMSFSFQLSHLHLHQILIVWSLCRWMHIDWWGGQLRQWRDKIMRHPHTVSRRHVWPELNEEMHNKLWPQTIQELDSASMRKLPTILYCLQQPDPLQ